MLKPKPSFFILGAPKCGTTSLAAWLAGHPQVYMSPNKEPHHFNTDQAYVIVRSRRQYERLFRRAGPKHLAIGEASVWYLYSDAAVPNILAYVPGARFIVCLRNPVDMAYSLHDQQVRSGLEDVTDFERAWQLQSARARDERVPRRCKERRHLLYGPACALGTQLERLLERVPRERVLPVLLEDVRVDPHARYLQVLDFLGLPDDGRIAFPVYNPASEHRHVILKQIILTHAALRRRLRLPALRTGIIRGLSRVNTRRRERPPLSARFEGELKAYFAPEIRLLEKQLGRNLQAWLAQPGSQRESPVRSAVSQDAAPGSWRL